MNCHGEKYLKLHDQSNVTLTLFCSHVVRRILPKMHHWINFYFYFYGVNMYIEEKVTDDLLDQSVTVFGILHVLILVVVVVVLLLLRSVSFISLGCLLFMWFLLIISRFFFFFFILYSHLCTPDPLSDHRKSQSNWTL